ncbi:hypothetical protein Sango_2243200 [Sesamum angolense]|uniref:Transmembrane protein n=1 Tax=Sesamum angolense TaxID=2727404 RepID=A0AAE1W959_9LAMI|nr:hypothetical protein Sango_2243200 [Sesamum angolense]
MGSRDADDENTIRQLIKERQKLEDKIINSEALVFQVASYFFVFQGMILTAVMGSKYLHCKTVWYAFLLNLIGSSLTLSALWVVTQKYEGELNDFDSVKTPYTSENGH